MNEKRVELHIHSMMSMDSIIQVDNLYEVSEKGMLEELAVTDYNTCCAFPKIYREITKYNESHEKIKVIYGVELSSSEGNIMILSKNKIGLSNMYKLVSLNNTKYDEKIPTSEVFDSKYKDLLIGFNVVQNKKVIEEIRNCSEEEIILKYGKYDYIEIEPVSNLKYLTGECFQSIKEIKDYLKRVIIIFSKYRRRVVAVSNGHYLSKKDKLAYGILKDKDIDKVSGCYIRNTREMLKEFDFLDEELAKEIVIQNSKAISKEIEDIEIVDNKLYLPDLDFVDSFTVNFESVKKAKEIYGLPIEEDVNKRILPVEIDKRITEELENIFVIFKEKYGIDASSIFYIAKDLVSYAKESFNYLTMARGSVNASFIAYLLGITKINPLNSHYICPKCHELIWSEGNPQDMVDKNCPKCKTIMNKDGYGLDSKTFFGEDGSSIDIDLNFGEKIQKHIFDYLQERFGEENVIRAGTIKSINDTMARRMVRKYFLKRNITKREADVRKIAASLTGVRRGNGHHPGGVIIVPDNININSFCPVRYPDINFKTNFLISDFDYHDICNNLLKVDVLGGDEPDILKKFEDRLDYKLIDIRKDDKKVLELISNSIIDKYCFNNLYLNKMIKTFDDFIKVLGICNGMGEYFNNISSLDDVISSRDDIYKYLANLGFDRKEALKIAKDIGCCKMDYESDEWFTILNKITNLGGSCEFISKVEGISYLFWRSTLIEMAWYIYTLFYVKYYNRDIYNEVVNCKIDKEELYKKILIFINYCDKVSISDLQKKFVIGINMAKEMIFRLQNEGFLKGYVVNKKRRIAYFRKRGMYYNSNFMVKCNSLYDISHVYFVRDIRVRKIKDDAVEFFDFNDYYECDIPLIESFITENKNKTYNLYITSPGIIKLNNKFKEFFINNSNFSFKRLKKIVFENVLSDENLEEMFSCSVVWKKVL